MKMSYTRHPRHLKVATRSRLGVYLDLLYNASIKLSITGKCGSLVTPDDAASVVPSCRFHPLR